MGKPHPLIAELAAIRRRRGLSQRAAGDLAGLSHQTVMRWENGQRTPRLAEAVAYAGALGYRITLAPGEM